MMSSLRSLRFGGQVALTAGFLGLLAWRVDLGDALATLPEATWVWVLPGLLLFTLAKAVHAYRWRIFLGPDRDVPYSGLLGIFLVHNMVNAVLLLRAGDLLRIQTTHQRYGIPRSELTAGVIVVETLLDGLAFVVLVAAAFVLGDITGGLRGAFWGMAGLALIGLGLGVAVALWAKPEALERTYPLRWLSRDIRARLVVMISQFLDGMRTLRDSRLAVPAIALSLIGWVMEAFSYYFFGQAFGLDLGFGAYLLIMMTANFAVSIPLTPSGIGPYEVATQELIVLLGADRTLAAGYAIGIHLSLILWISAVGLVAMWLMKLTPAEIFYIDEPEAKSGAQPEAP
jgi:uncharacterized protein (TIRG00374 family)